MNSEECSTALRRTQAGAPTDRVTLEEKVAFLSSQSAHAGASAKIEVRETHMSWVFLTDAFAYKLKKPVCHPFLDYRTLMRRRYFCEEELRLNLRLAPTVYLGVIPLSLQPDGLLRLGGEDGDGEIVDWLVMMRRLQDAQLLDVALKTRTATKVGVSRAADQLARFYVAAPPVQVPEKDYVARFAHELRLNRSTLDDGAYGLQTHTPAAVLDTLDGFLAEERDVLLERLDARHIVEGHGDLRPEHVYIGEPAAVIDCLEFDRALRLLDPFEELAFLAMECTLLDGTWAGRLILDRCAVMLGGRPPEHLLAFYAAFRACVRARLCIAHLQEPAPREPAKWRPLALRYLAHAAAACATLRHHPPASR